MRGILTILFMGFLTVGFTAAATNGPNVLQVDMAQVTVQELLAPGLGVSDLNLYTADVLTTPVPLAIEFAKRTKSEVLRSYSSSSFYITSNTENLLSPKATKRTKSPLLK